MPKRVPQENCKPYYDQWLKCVDGKDNCCGPSKCNWSFTNWQDCHKYNDIVKAHNLISSIR